MVGITAYGAYVPMLRLPLGKPGGPEKAVANWDEDAVTMAVAAAIDCLRGIDRAIRPSRRSFLVRIPLGPLCYGSEHNWCRHDGAQVAGGS